MVNVLTKEHQEFKKNNSNYLTNISKNNEIIIQLLHPFSLESMPELKTTKFGYAIFLSFPESNVLYERFKESRYYSVFTKEKNNFQDIPCYAFVSLSELEAAEIISDLLTNTYGYSANDTFGMDAMYQGEVV